MSTRAAVFSLSAGQRLRRDACLSTRTATCSKRSLVDLPPETRMPGRSHRVGTHRRRRPRRPRRRSGARCGHELEWLSPRSRRAWRTTALTGSAWKPTAVHRRRRLGRAGRRSAASQPAGPGTDGPRHGWGLALRTAQIREEARTLSEQLAEANRQLHDAQSEILRTQDDDHRRRDGRRRGARDEQPAGGNLRAIAVAGVADYRTRKHKAAANLIHEQATGSATSSRS